MGSIRRALVALATAAAATLALAAPAHAGLLVKSAQNCDSPSSARVFQQWLDPSHYVRRPAATPSPPPAGR